MANEKRLIDANAFIEDIKTEAMNLYLDGMKGTPRPRSELYDIIDRIGEQPTVDAVEVVRCKDCKHFIQEEHGCNHFGYYSHTPWVDEVDFCSYGERKDRE